MKKLIVTSVALVCLVFAQNAFAENPMNLSEEASGEAKGHNETGIEEFNQDNCPNAVLSWSIAAKKDPTHGEALYNLGLCYHKMSETDKATMYFKEAAKRAGDNSSILGSSLVNSYTSQD